MDLSVPSGYESYSYRLDPHDEVDDGYAAKAFRPVSDQQVLLRRRHVRNKRRETFDAVRLCLRIFILLLDLSILSLLIHGVNIWETTYTSVDRNEDGWTRTQWASVKMLSTWLMLVIAAFASFIQMVAIATHLSFPQSLRDGWVHTGAVLASSGITIAGWVAATVYLIIDKELKDMFDFCQESLVIPLQHVGLRQPFLHFWMNQERPNVYLLDERSRDQRYVVFHLVSLFMMTSSSAVDLPAKRYSFALLFSRKIFLKSSLL
ncbi:hypothetical protein FOYG_03991 [Fusarium oxysporum NRRL 32931]|uniref:Uncharacterized protein n=1 Tax=Fusarium oxysporum NRRL 32931 TaxID=660029 RepID=W9J3B3_FUSOX|nr:hypothetical protein FOYG_03991 [Fusarium oxysporum NRRL 32931]